MWIYHYFGLTMTEGDQTCQTIKFETILWVTTQTSETLRLDLGSWKPRGRSLTIARKWSKKGDLVKVLVGFQRILTLSNGFTVRGQQG